MREISKMIYKKFLIISMSHLIVLFLVSNLLSAELKFSYSFDNPNAISGWHNIGDNAYKTIEGFDKLPGAGYPENILTVSNQSNIDIYHDIEIGKILKDGSETNALYLSTLKNDYPNRCTMNIVPDNTNPWTEYYQEWKVYYSSTFLDRFRSGHYWNSQHTIWYDGLQTVLLQLFSSNNKVYSRLSFYEQSSACTNKSLDNQCQAGIEYDLLNSIKGKKEGISGYFFYVSDSTTEILGEKWYKFGFYYKRGAAAGGEVKFFIDDKLILHVKGDTSGISVKPGAINFIKLYGSKETMPHEMWIDDYKLYNTIPDQLSEISFDAPLRPNAPIGVKAAAVQ